MRTHRILLGLIVLNFLISCEKSIKKSSLAGDLQDVAMKNVSVDSTTNPQTNFVAITCLQTVNWVDTVNSFNIAATAAFTRNGVLVNTGPVVINSRTITAGPTNLYQYNYTDSNNLEEGESLLGSTVQITATGAGGVRSSGTITVPKAIFPSTSYYPRSTIDRSVALPVKWAPDPNNQYHQVYIELYYMKGISKASHANMPDTLPHLWYQAADNGSFTVPQADLSVFPNGAFVEIAITRASYINSSADFADVATTAVQTTPILVTTPSKINGSSCFYFSSNVRSGSGTITGAPGATATFTVNASGPPSGSYTTSFTISGATFTDGTTNLLVTNGAASKQVVIPASGQFTWGGTFSEPNSFGSGSICVQ